MMQNAYHGCCCEEIQENQLMVECFDSCWGSSSCYIVSRVSQSVIMLDIEFLYFRVVLVYVSAVNLRPLFNPNGVQNIKACARIPNSILSKMMVVRNISQFSLQSLNLPVSHFLLTHQANVSSGFINSENGPMIICV
jgi:hypothetical protein